MCEIKNQKSKIIFVGLGRGGIRTLDLLERNTDADYIICDTDNFHLNKSGIENKILLIHDSNSISPNSFNTFEKHMEDKFIVFFVCSLGGKIGFEILPKLLAISNKLNVTSICILSKPFQFEGVIKNKISSASEKAIKKLATSTIVIENEKCQNLYSNFNLSNAFHFSHQFLARNCVYFETILITYSVICFDAADLVHIIRNCESSIICEGISSKDNRLYNSFLNACNHPNIKSYLISQFDKMLLYFQCSSTHIIAMEEIEQFLQIHHTLPNTTINWSFSINEELDENVTVILIASISDKAVRRLRS